jgi:hypothetical protein
MYENKPKYLHLHGACYKNKHYIIWQMWSFNTKKKHNFPI